MKTHNRGKTIRKLPASAEPNMYIVMRLVKGVHRCTDHDRTEYAAAFWSLHQFVLRCSRHGPRASRTTLRRNWQAFPGLGRAQCSQTDRGPSCGRPGLLAGTRLIAAFGHERRALSARARHVPNCRPTGRRDGTGRSPRRGHAPSTCSDRRPIRQRRAQI